MLINFINTMLPNRESCLYGINQVIYTVQTFNEFMNLYYHTTEKNIRE